MRHGSLPERLLLPTIDGLSGFLTSISASPIELAVQRPRTEIVTTTYLETWGHLCHQGYHTEGPHWTWLGSVLHHALWTVAGSIPLVRVTSEWDLLRFSMTGPYNSTSWLSIWGLDWLLDYCGYSAVQQCELLSMIDDWWKSDEPRQFVVSRNSVGRVRNKSDTAFMLRESCKSICRTEKSVTLYVLPPGSWYNKNGRIRAILKILLRDRMVMLWRTGHTG